VTEGARLPRSRAVGLALVTISGATFGTLAISARYAYSAGGEPLGVLAWRFVVASAVLISLMVVRRERWPRGRLLAQLAALGLGYVAQSLAFFTALEHASAGLVSLLLYLYPGLVTALSVAFLGERLTPAKWWALGLAMAGSALTVAPALGMDPAGSAEPLGIVLGVTSALCYAVYITLGSAVTLRAGPLPSTTVILTCAALLYGFLAVITGAAVPRGAFGVAALLALALLGTVVPVLTFFAGMQRVGPTETASLSAFEPAVTVGLAAMLLGERLASLQLLGGALVLAAVVVLARARPPLAEPVV